MDLKANRLGKIALLAAISDEEEGQLFKEAILKRGENIKLAVTVISGMTSSIKQTFAKSIVSCALQNEIIEKKAPQIHGLIHAGMDAFSGAFTNSSISGSVKLKVSIVSNGAWIAVAVYGDSAFYPMTNHEQCCLGVMHL